MGLLDKICPFIFSTHCPYTTMNALGCPYNNHGYKQKGVRVPSWCPLTEVLYKETTLQVAQSETFSFHMIDRLCIDSTKESPTINLDKPLEGQPSLEDLIKFIPDKIQCDI